MPKIFSNHFASISLSLKGPKSFISKNRLYLSKSLVHKISFLSRRVLHEVLYTTLLTLAFKQTISEQKYIINLGHKSVSSRLFIGLSQ